MADLSVILEPPPGTILGETDYSIPGQISASNNWRYADGKGQVIGGWTSYYSAAGPTSGSSTNALEWYSRAGTRYLVVGGTAGVNLNSGATLGTQTDIIYGGFSSATRWTFRNWGEQLLANPAGGTLYYHDLNLANNLTALSNAPAVIGCFVVDPKARQVLVGNCSQVDGTGVNPRAIRISNAENNNDWTPTPSNLSDEVILDGTGGQIRAMEMVGPYVCVWTDSELFAGQSTGDPSQPYRFERVDKGCGCRGKDTVAVANGVAYWISTDLRPMMWVPGSLPVDIPGVPSHYLNMEVAGVQFDKTLLGSAFVLHNRKFNEIWFFPVLAGATYPTTYVAVSIPSIGTDRPIWFPGTMDRSMMYQGINDVFGCRNASPIVYQHEIGKHGAANTLLTWSYSMIVYIDKGKRRVMVKRVVPDFENQAGNVTLTVSALAWPQGAETTVATKTVAVGDDKTDFRASGRLLRFQWSGNDGTGSTDTFARSGSTTIEYAVLGGR